MKQVIVVAVVAVISCYAGYELRGAYEDPKDPIDMVYISIFDSIGVLPNNFAIDLNMSKGEIYLSGEQGSVVAGRGSIEETGLFSIIKDSSATRYERCGIDIMEVKEKDVSLIIASKERHYAVLTNVTNDVVDQFFDVICKIAG